jgi:hypothetical protein
VLVVENETTYLALPPVPDTVAVFGGGYAVRALAPLAWLHGREATPVAVEPAHLTPDESQVYRDLIADRHAPALRLEQERIRFSLVEQALTR